MPDEEAIERGRVAWREVMGFEPPPVEDPYAEFTTELFDRVWGRPGLSRRDRRLVSLTAIATRGLQMPLGVHIEAAISSGDVTAEELHEWIVHLAHYAGWPSAAEAYGTLRGVLARHGGGD